MAEANSVLQEREKRVVAAASVAAAVSLTVMKLVVGLMTGSLGILAEAAHSGLDLVAAVITYFAIRVSGRPADASHMYGHGKVENLSALAETLLLLLTCLWIVYEAMRRLLYQAAEVDPSLWAFLVMGISVAVDFSRSRALARVARKYGSQALEADALHFSTDMWSSAVVIAGLSLVWYGGRTGDKGLYVHADAVAALAVAVIVIYASLRLGRRTIDALVDRAPFGLAQRLEFSASQVSRVRSVLGTRVRTAGNQIFVDMSISVPRHLSFEESHEVTRQVKEAVRAASPDADVIVHAIPVAENEGVLEMIQAATARKHVASHNITAHWTRRGLWIDLDIEVDPDITFERAHALATDIESELRADLGKMPSAMPIADVNVHIEPRHEELAAGREMEPGEAAAYSERIERIQRELPHARGCRDVVVHKMRGKIYLSFHLLVDAHCPIAQVHGIAEEMETRLRGELPRLGRVVIHTEPHSR